MEHYDNECEYCTNRECDHLNYIETYTSAGVVALCDDCYEKVDEIFTEWGIEDVWN